MPKFNLEELMKRAKIEEEKRGFDLNSGALKTLSRYGKKVDLVANNLKKILNNPCEFVVNSETGEKKTFQNMREVMDVFGNYNEGDPTKAPMYGKPFTELGRNPSAHFLMYLVSTGIKKEELTGLLEEKLSPSMEDMLKGKQKEFYEIIMDENQERRTDRLATMYVNFMDHIRDINDARVEADQIGDYENGSTYGALIGNAQSYLFQTLNLSHQRCGNMEKVPAETNALIEKIDEKTKNLSYNIDTMNTALLGSSFYENIGSALDILKLNQENGEYLSEEEKNDAISKSMKMTILPNFKAMEAHAAFMTAEDDPYSKTTDEYGFEIMATMALPVENDEAKRQIINKVAAEDAMDELLDQLTKNTKTTFFGMKKIANSDQYNAVVEALKDYKNGDGTIDAVVDSCSDYLKNKTPDSEKGQERYVLIQQVFDYASEKNDTEVMKSFMKKTEIPDRVIISASELQKLETEANEKENEKSKEKGKEERLTMPVKHAEVESVRLLSH